MKDSIKKFLFNKKTIISLILLLVVGILIGYSGAYYMVTLDVDDNLVTTECFKLTLEDQDEINLQETYPLSDQEGSNLKPYKFKIKNVCKKAANYQVNLETINSSSLDTMYVKSKLDEEEVIKLSEREEVEEHVNDNVKESRKLAEGILLENEEVEYNLRLWIDEDSTVEQSADKTWRGKVVVISTLNKNPYKVLALNANGGEVTPSSLQIVEGRVAGTLPTPVRVGHTFNGWFTENEEGSQVTETTIINENQTIYAHWNANIYDLVVNPNSGTWEGYTTEQTYQVTYNTTKNISDPTKTGYRFTNWTLEGTNSSIENQVFTMGEENASLTANYEKNTYKLTVNPDGGEWSGSTSSQEFDILYEGTKNIEDPVRDRYTFKGWSVSGAGSTEESGTFTMGYENATLTAQWEANDYPYIVYHYKENINDDNYTLVDGDTYTRNAQYNSEVSPTPNTYTGFVSPSSKTITIKKTDNVVEYNYSRIRSKLTINPNGGKYNNSTSNTEINNKKYESTENLLTPTKDGYTFNQWTISGAGTTILDNTLTMGYENATITASWTINTYTITYDANGGTVSPGSDQVNHGDTLNLPTPIREGYSFEGWYTDATNGTQVTNSTTWTSSQRIYAHWKKNYYNLTLENAKFADNSTSKSVEYGEVVVLTAVVPSSYTESSYSGQTSCSSSSDSGNIKYKVKHDYSVENWSTGETTNQIIYTTPAHDSEITANIKETTSQTDRNECYSKDRDYSPGYYYCASGGSRSGTTCTKTTTSTYNASYSSGYYYCDSGDSRSGSTCTKTTTYNATKVSDEYYTCDEGTLSGNKCILKDSFDFMSKNKNDALKFCKNFAAPSGYTCGSCLDSGIDSVTYSFRYIRNCTKTVGDATYHKAVYSCNSGDSLSNTTCTHIETYDAHYSSGYYYCANGGTRSGTTCTTTSTSTYDASWSSGYYYCSSGTESGGYCWNWRSAS